MKPAEARRVLFVLGMHRSGTSALCAALQACGGSFGSCLLAPMDGVNDEGFWEDSEVVRVNESLLELAGSAWFAVTPAVLGQDWQAEGFDEDRIEAGRILQRGFGDSPLEIVKDPRLCITLPFWLAACREAGIATSVCVIRRAPVEVARSLEKRDGFPPGYGLRLLQTYRRGIARHAPPEALQVSYRGLLEDPVAVMGQLAQQLPLQVDETALTAVVRADLRHQVAAGQQGPLDREDGDDSELAALDAQIAEAYPREQTLAEFARCLVNRGDQLTRIGESHTAALATLDERDADLDKLAGEHSAALATIAERDQQISALDERLAETGEHLAQSLATIDERDGQIVEFDRRLADIGAQHSHALEVIDTRDAQLQRVFAKPGIGLLFRAMWKHETR